MSPLQWRAVYKDIYEKIYWAVYSNEYLIFILSRVFNCITTRHTNINWITRKGDLMNAYQKLEELFNELTHLEQLQALASWDEATMMPTGGGAARAAALSTLCTIHHQKLVHEKVGELIEQAQLEQKLDAWQQRNLQLMQRQYQHATCLPEKLVTALAEKRTLCEQAWRVARHENNWNAFAPKLTELFNLVKESALIRSDVFGKEPYDVLLDDFSPDVTQAMINPIFDRLKSELPTLINSIMQQQQHHPITPLAGVFPIDKQRELGLMVMQHIGFDFNHGRLDTSHHPFCGGFSEDVRITTRYDEHDFLSSLFGICHETGHACYEQGLPKKWNLQPVGHAFGMSVHESQSLIIEMPTCRSFEFMQFLTPQALKIFGAHPALSAENLYRIATRVEKSLIRVEADEVTYPLHIILRYEIERDLFNNQVTILELPDLWHEKMQEYLGLSTHGNDRNGVLQDVHWPSAAFGYFPAYTIGRLIAAQLFATALKIQPTIPQCLTQGNFKPLMQWLNNTVHAKASSLTMDALLKEATGEPLNPDYFINYIRTRYLS